MHTHKFSYILTYAYTYTHTYSNIRIYKGGITNERAIIIVGHLHCLFVSVCAAVAPLSSQQKLYYQPGDEKEAPAGVIIKPVPGMCMHIICMLIHAWFHKYICSYMYKCIFIFNMLMCTCACAI